MTTFTNKELIKEIKERISSLEVRDDSINSDKGKASCHDKGHSPCCRTRLEVAGKSACHQDTSGQKQASQMAGKGGSKTPY